MATSYSQNPATNGLVLYFDTANALKSFRGEPTVNIGANVGLNDLGAGLTYLGIEDGWKKYSMSGTWTNGTYPYSMALSSVTFTGGLPYTSVATIKTSAQHKFNTFGYSGISYVNEPKDLNGTASATQNPDGSYTVRRTNFAYTNTTAQQGYLYTNPVDGITFDPATDFVWLKEVQIEQKAHPTPYVNGTRSTTDGLLDMMGNYVMDATNVSYDSNAFMTFDGSSDYIDVLESQNIIAGTQDFAIEAAYDMRGQAGGAIFGNFGPSYTTDHVWFSGQYGIWLNGAVYAPGSPLANGKYHMVGMRRNGLMSLYLNGELVNSASRTASIVADIEYRIGADTNSPNEPFIGDIYMLKVYNRSLSAEEIKANFAGVKSRYGI